VTPDLPQRRNLSERDVHLDYRLTGTVEVDEDAQLRILSADEQARADRFVFPQHRTTFIAAHWLLRTTLSRYADVAPREWVFVRNPYGKPLLGDEQRRLAALDFNLAHTEGLIACVVRRGGAVGVDVESMRHRGRSVEIARRFFSPQEIRELDACPAHLIDARFVELWTLKEAYVKAVGTGLSRPLDTFSFAFTGRSGLRFESALGDAATWDFALLAPTPDHRIAVAVGRGADGPARITIWARESVIADAALLRTSLTG